MSANWTERSRDIESFKVMDLLKRAKVLSEEGQSILNLGIGEPDFGAAPRVISEAKRVLDQVPLSYTPAAGISALREKIAEFHYQRYGHSINPDQVLVTSGASAGLLLAFALVAERDKHVLMADPGYPCNRQFLRVLEASSRSIPVDYRDNFHLSAEQVAQYWREDTAGVLLASPANPTGAVIAPNQLEAIANETRKRGGALIVDEIYHGLTYGVETPTAVSFDPEAIAINSFSKFFGMTGWRLGWLVSSAEAVVEMEKIAQNLFISAPTLSQYAALAAFEPVSLALFEQRRVELQARRDILLKGLLALGFKVPQIPQGAFYIYADASDLTDDSFSWCWRLLEEAGVVATPGIDFGHNHAERFVRFTYTTPQTQIREALERIAHFLDAKRG